MKWVKGFTLLEVLITLLIMGILLTMAVSNFQSHLQKARRVEATSTLMTLAMAQERYFMQHLTYTADITGTSGLNYQALHTENGYYALSVQIQTQANDGIDSFKLKATAISTQQNDTECQQFTINQLSAHNAFDKNNVSNPTCW